MSGTHTFQESEPGVHRLRIALVLALTSITGTLCAQTGNQVVQQRCHTGTLLGVDTRTEIVPTTSTQHGVEKEKDGKKVYDGYSTPSESKRTVYVLHVAVDGMV